jgi:hypothetical protein
VSSLHWLLLCASLCSGLTGFAEGEDTFISKIPVNPSYVPPQFRLSGPTVQTQVTVLITVKTLNVNLPMLGFLFKIDGS